MNLTPPWVFSVATKLRLVKRAQRHEHLKEIVCCNNGKQTVWWWNEYENFLLVWAAAHFSSVQEQKPRADPPVSHIANDANGSPGFSSCLIAVQVQTKFRPCRTHCSVQEHGRRAHVPADTFIPRKKNSHSFWWVVNTHPISFASVLGECRAASSCSDTLQTVDCQFSTAVLGDHGATSSKDAANTNPLHPKEYRNPIVLLPQTLGENIA